MSAMNLPPVTAQQTSQELAEQLARLLCAYDAMVMQQGPQLEAKYVQAFGALDKQAYEAYVRVVALKRQIELVREYLTRGVEPDELHIELTLARELKTYQAGIERINNKIAWAQLMAKLEANEDDNQRLNRLYQDMARGLQPELQTGQTEEDQGLWQRVSAAYEKGDLAELEGLHEIYQAKERGGQAPLSEEAEKQRRRQLRGKIQVCLTKIDKLVAAYPFSCEDMLRQPAAIKQHQQKLQQQVDKYQAQIADLQEYLALLTAPPSDILH